MGRQLAKLLHADIPTLAKALERKGRRGDTILAHINPQEAALLKARGGSASKNPETGLLEFFDGELDFEPITTPVPEPQVTQTEAPAGGTFGGISPAQATSGYELSAPDRKSTRLNSSHTDISRMPSSA